MNEKTVLKRSEMPMMIQLIVVGITGILLFIFASQLFRAIDNVLPFDTSALTALARFIMFGLLVVALIIVYLNSKKVSYYMTKDSIAVVRGAFGAKNKRVYGLDNVTGMSMNQSFLGSKMNYGNVTVELSMMTSAETIQLTNLDDPERVLEHIRKITKKF
jgi:uncharacterized membrane protein YdbT with pleckstrin-like domain